MTTKKVVLIGHNFNSILGLARALGAEGYEIGAIRTGANKNSWIKRIGQTPEASSKYIKKYRIASTNDVSGILSLLLNEFADQSIKTVLIPVDDICAELIDKHLSELSPYYYLPNVNDTPGGVIRLMDKYYQKQLAREAGLPVPDGWSVKIENGVFQIPDEVTYPCFAKAEMPMRGRKQFMGKCSSKAELEDLLRRAGAYQDCIMIVEEYISIDKEFGSVGVCNREKVCVPAITEKTALGHGTNAGVTVCGKIHKPERYLETAEKMRSMMSKMSYQGMFDIDLYESNGIMYFNELNLRVGAEGIGTLIAGVNLAKMFADGVTGNDGEVDYSVTAEEITFTNEKPLISDWAEGFISWKEYKHRLNNVQKLYIESEDDKGPANSFKWHIARQFLRKMKLQIRKK